jgi:hypothetical protein
MLHIKSLFRSLSSSTPTINYYDGLLGRPELKSWPLHWPNFTLHIDAVTGERRQVRDALEHFKRAATALATSSRDGGLGLVARKQVVGILSQNCLVCPKIPFRGHLCRLPTMYPVLVFALLKIAVPELAQMESICMDDAHGDRNSYLSRDCEPWMEVAAEKATELPK